MAAVLVVCTGNVCRSPVAEGLVRATLRGRFGASAPTVASAGIAGWEGSRADPNSIAAAAEAGVDISSHRGRRLRARDAEDAALVIAMAREHVEAVVELAPSASERTFTLKELVRLLEAAPSPGRHDGGPVELLADRVAAAASLRSSGFAGNPFDDDIADPLGLPLEAFRAMTWEIGGWAQRLDDAMFGAAAPAAVADGA
jgi:protein-tyrosine phosphatase